MKLIVITPVGPGHEKIVQGAIDSVKAANPWKFDSIRHVIIEDHHGMLGRSRARNIGMLDSADWYFFLDADDRLATDALRLNDFKSPATFGAVCLDGRIGEHNIYPCGWDEILKYGALGTLSMGFFCRADVARRIKFNENLDHGEDFYFYMRLPSFTKVKPPLVDIGYSLPSAGGPRGYERIDWIATCNRIIKNDFSRHAVLEKDRRSGNEPVQL